MKTKKLLRDTLILTAASLIMRGLGILFSSYLSSVIGAEGLGVLHLILSACNFAVSAAGSGITLSAIRLVVSARAKGMSVGRTLRLCFIYSLFPGFIAAAGLFFSAASCAALIGYPETAGCMRLFALSLPFISLSCALSGFFTAERLSGVYAGVQLFEQLAKILFSMLLLLLIRARTAVDCCFAVIVSQCVSSAANTAVSFLLYRRASLRDAGRGAPKMRELLKIALPDSVSSCLRSALVTVRQLFVPRAFEQSGISAAEGIATFGIIQSMALPVVFFASCISSSFSSLLIPEIADCVARGEKNKADTHAVKALKLTFLYAVFVSAAVWLSAPLVAERLFPGRNADFYIRLLSPIIPISYMDTTTDCILKGLGLQLDSMRFNIIEAAVCLAMVLTLVPRFGIWGYVLMIFTGEILNFAMSISRLAFKLSSSPRGGDKEHENGIKLKSAHKHIENQKKLYGIGKDREIARGSDE